MEYSFVEHPWQHHEWRVYPLSRFLLLWDDVYDHDAAQRLRVTAWLASAVCAGRTDAIALGVGPGWG